MITSHKPANLSQELSKNNFITKKMAQAKLAYR